MRRYRIVLVEDESLVAIDSRRRLEKLGHEVVAIAPNGPAAIAAVRELGPDLVLMDIGLPGAMDGIAAAGLIREVRDVPVVYLTAHDEEPVLARAKLTDPYGYLLKPSTDRELQVVVELAVYRHEMEREKTRLQTRIRRLEELVPICSCCRKVRDDGGFRQRVEDYLGEHGTLAASQGLCPDCRSAGLKTDAASAAEDSSVPPPGST